MPSFARAAGVLPGGSWRLPVLVVTRTAASAAVPTAGDDPHDDPHDHELTPAELAGFVAELVDARATIDFLKGRVSTLTSLLDSPPVLPTTAPICTLSSTALSSCLQAVLSFSSKHAVRRAGRNMNSDCFASDA